MTNPKEIIFEDDAREKLQKGIEAACNAVCMTLGPKGRNVGLDSSFGEPKITSDGHTILQDIELKDTFENMGAAIVKEAASKMKETCGDGTTTTTVLLHKMVQNGLKFITSGASPISLKRGMEKALESIVKSIQKISTPIESQDQIRHIATVSASGDTLVGEMIAKAIEKVGREGVITIDEGKSTETILETVEGLQFDRGYISAYFATDADKMIATYDNPYFLITDRKIGSVHDIIHLLQGVAASASPLIIIADDVEGEALSTLAINHVRGTLRVCAIKAPGFGDRRKALLEDLACVTGSQMISEEKGLLLKETSLEALGRAQKVTVTKETTTIVSGSGKTEAISQRVRQIDNEIENSSNKFDKEKLQERKAKLLGGVAVIRVGAASESALKNLKQKFEDSLSSTKAALESGIVIGAGMALSYSSQAVKNLELEGDEKLGAQVVALACQDPAKQIVSNAGHDGNVVLANLLKEVNYQSGFNAESEKVENLLQVGVIDATKVVVGSLNTAVSSSSVILLSEALIADAKEEK